MILKTVAALLGGEIGHFPALFFFFMFLEGFDDIITPFTFLEKRAIGFSTLPLAQF